MFYYDHSKVESSPHNEYEYVFFYGFPFQVFFILDFFMSEYGLNNKYFFFQVVYEKLLNILVMKYH